MLELKEQEGKENIEQGLELVLGVLNIFKY